MNFLHKSELLYHINFGKKITLELSSVFPLPRKKFSLRCHLCFFVYFHLNTL